MASAPTTPAALKKIARDFVDALCITRDRELARSFMAEDVAFTHDSLPPMEGRDRFLTAWFEHALRGMPHFKLEPLDSIAEVDPTTGRGGRVWTYARITGADAAGTACKDTVDMMVIGEDGKILRSKDVQRLL